MIASLVPQKNTEVLYSHSQSPKNHQCDHPHQKKLLSQPLFWLSDDTMPQIQLSEMLDWSQQVRSSHSIIKAEKLY